MSIPFFLPGVECRDLQYTISAAGPSGDSDYARGPLSSSSGSPYFTSRPDTYKEEVRESVTLKCNVENLGKKETIAFITTPRTSMKFKRPICNCYFGYFTSSQKNYSVPADTTDCYHFVLAYISKIKKIYF